jgi:caffeoyl-CoA O-methyltransferase
MASGAEHLAPGLHEYLISHSTAPDALLRDLIAETAARFPDRARLQIGPEQGTFMTMLAGLMGARHTAASSTPSPIPTPLRSGSSTSMCSPTTGSSMPCSLSETA